jgi:nucleoside-diphosphate-sugar epimerase
VTEKDSTEPSSEASRISVEAESVLRRANEGKMRILRFAGICGPGRVVYEGRLRSGQFPGDADRCCAASVDCGVDGEAYNVCDDEPVRRGDYCLELSRLLGLEPPAERSPSEPERGLANRRVSKAKMKRELLATLRYPTYREGLAASVSKL